MLCIFRIVNVFINTVLVRMSIRSWCLSKTHSSQQVDSRRSSNWCRQKRLDMELQSHGLSTLQAGNLPPNYREGQQAIGGGRVMVKTSFEQRLSSPL